MSVDGTTRFFFNVRSGQTLVRETAGWLLPNREAAISAAPVHGVRIVPHRECEGASRLEITTENGAVVAIVPIAPGEFGRITPCT